MTVLKYTMLSKVLVAIIHIAMLSLVGFTIWLTKNPWWIFIILLLPSPNVNVTIENNELKEQ